jgi:arylsulfatase A-like enzyme
MDIKNGVYDPRPDEREWIQKLYLGEVRYVDAMFGELMERLRELGVYDDALIIFSSDHGEEFWDHGDYGHGQSLFHELIQVPLMIKTPGGSRTGRVEAPVWTVSLAPTILDFAGVGYGAEEFSAPSLAPLLRDANEGVRPGPIYSETAPEAEARHRWGVRFDSYEYMQSAAGRTEDELYDLERDPKQMNDVSSSATLATGRGHALLSDYHEHNGELRMRHEIELRGEIELPEEEMNRLRKLGYIQ